MSDTTPPQIENERLDIDDKNPGSEGGPPIWIALAIVGGIFLACAAVVFALVYML